jgi:WD40 repeat protein
MLAEASRFRPEEEWVRLRDVTTGQVIRRFKGGPDIAFLPDGKTLVAVGEREGGGVTVRLVTLETGAELRKFAVPSEKEDQFPIVALSPDGRVLAVGTDGEIRLLDVATGKERGTLQSLKKIVRMMFAPDGRTLFTKWAFFTEEGELVEKSEGVTITTRIPPKAVDPEIRLWDVDSMTEFRRPEGDAQTVGKVIFSPDGKTLAATDGDAIRLWDVATGKGIRTFRGHQKDANVVAFSPDGKTLAAGYGKTVFGMGGPVQSDGGTILFWDVATGEMRRKLEGHKFGVAWLAFSPDGRTLVSVEHGEGIKFWLVGTDKAAATLAVAAGGSC